MIRRCASIARRGTHVSSRRTARAMKFMRWAESNGALVSNAGNVWQQSRTAAALGPQPQPPPQPPQQRQSQHHHRYEQQQQQAQPCIIPAIHVRHMCTQSPAKGLPWPSDGHAAGPAHLYNAFVQQGVIRDDPGQRAAVQRLQALFERTRSYDNADLVAKYAGTGASTTTTTGSSSSSSGASPWSWIKSRLQGTAGTGGGSHHQGPGGGGGGADLGLESALGQGVNVYMFGGVGTGKTFLMDVLYHSYGRNARKQRAHFHAFMLDVHRRMHRWRQTKADHEHDPITPVADALAHKAWLLCFDEFQVTDVADAMILQRLFNALLQRGVVVVATSNRHPTALYKNGLNRPLFEPFIDSIVAHWVIHELDSGLDYRLSGTKGTTAVYHVGADRQQRLRDQFQQLTHGTPIAAETLSVNGRQLVVNKAARGCAWFAFDDLCANVMGAADFLAIAQHFHTVALADIPQLDDGRLESARRFITLIDALYEHKVKVICSAATQPQDIFRSELQQSGGGRGEEEAFAFARAASRLMEMQSMEYLRMPHVTH